MGLKIMTDGRGGMRETWYARFTRNGQKVNVNLRVPIRGTVPRDASGRYDVNGRGDEAFDRSRQSALRALADMQAAAKTTGKTEAVKHAEEADLRERYYRARTGKSIAGVKLADLPKLWRGIKRTYTPGESWCEAVETWFARFAKFATGYADKHGTKCDTVDDITPELAAAWFEDIKEAFAWETVTKQWSLMRGAFRRYSTNGKPNPFEDVVMRNREIAKARVNRVPLTMAEVERLFECAREDAATYQLVVCAACTGMRIGDVCGLKWADVNLREGLIDCATDKTGKRVTIPIFNRLREVLDARAALPVDGRTPSAYVFPVAADRYASNPDGIYRDVKPIFARAVFGDEQTAEDVGEDGGSARPLPEVIDAAGFGEAKRTRLLDVYRRIKSGERSVDIADALGCARSQVSMDLREIEQLTCEALRPRAIATSRRKRKLDLIEKTRAERRGKGRQRAASLYGWHSLRATFVVLAVEAGVPLETVRLIVGHSTAKTTMEYFNPTAKHAAEAVRERMNATPLGSGRVAIGETMDAGTGTPATSRRTAEDWPQALALARAVIGGTQAAATCDAVLKASGVDTARESERAFALVLAAVPAEVRRQVVAVCRAAGLGVTK